MEKSYKKFFKDKKAKKSYITWEDNDMDSLGDLENEFVNLSFMAKNYVSKEEVTSSNDNLCQGPKKIWVPKSKYVNERFLEEKLAH